MCTSAIMLCSAIMGTVCGHGRKEKEIDSLKTKPQGILMVCLDSDADISYVKSSSVKVREVVKNLNEVLESKLQCSDCHMKLFAPMKILKSMR